MAMEEVTEAAVVHMVDDEVAAAEARMAAVADIMVAARNCTTQFISLLMN